MVPTLIHPVPVILEPLNAATAPRDEEARELVHGARRGTKVRISAQVSWSLKDDPTDHPAGVVEISKGYVLVRRRDLERMNLTIARGDRISKIGVQAVDVYVTGTQPRGHYPDQGGHTLLRVYWGDRQPVRRAA